MLKNSRSRFELRICKVCIENLWNHNSIDLLNHWNCVNLIPVYSLDVMERLFILLLGYCIGQSRPRSVSFKISPSKTTWTNRLMWRAGVTQSSSYRSPISAPSEPSVRNCYRLRIKSMIDPRISYFTQFGSLMDVSAQRVSQFTINYTFLQQPGKEEKM